MSNEFFVLQRLHHSNLLNQLENLFQVWSERVVPFSFPPVPKKSSANTLMILVMGFLGDGFPVVGSTVFSFAASISDRSRDFSEGVFCAVSAVRWLLVSSVPKHALRDCKEYNTQQLRSAHEKTIS